MSNDFSIKNLPPTQNFTESANHEGLASSASSLDAKAAEIGKDALNFLDLSSPRIDQAEDVPGFDLLATVEKVDEQRELIAAETYVREGTSKKAYLSQNLTISPIWVVGRSAAIRGVIDLISNKTFVLKYPRSTGDKINKARDEQAVEIIKNDHQSHMLITGGIKRWGIQDPPKLMQKIKMGEKDEHIGYLTEVYDSDLLTLMGNGKYKIDSLERGLMAIEQILSALAYAHHMNAVDSDVGSQNILVKIVKTENGEEIELFHRADFGGTIFLDRYGMNTFPKQVEYNQETGEFSEIEFEDAFLPLPQERMYSLHTIHVDEYTDANALRDAGKYEEFGKLVKKTEVFSTGVILFQLFTSESVLPFSTVNLNVADENGKKVSQSFLETRGDYKDVLEKDYNVPKELAGLIGRMLNTKASLRPTAKEVKAEFEKILDNYPEVKQKIAAHKAALGYKPDENLEEATTVYSRSYQFVVNMLSKMGSIIGM